MKELYEKDLLSEEKLEEIFDEFDLSNDGFIDVNELGKSLDEVYDPEDTLVDREIWSKISKKPFINHKKFKEIFKDSNNIDFIGDKINLEKNPNMTFWQFLRSKYTKEREDLDKEIDKLVLGDEEDAIGFNSMIRNIGEDMNNKVKKVYKNPLNYKIKKPEDEPTRRKVINEKEKGLKISTSPRIVIRENGERRFSPVFSGNRYINHQQTIQSNSPSSRFTQRPYYRNPPHSKKKLLLNKLILLN